MAKAQYLEELPDFFRNALLITAADLLLCLVAAFLFFNSRHGQLRIPATILLCVALLLSFWLLFTLM